MFRVEPAVDEPAKGLGGQHQIGVRPALAGDELDAVRLPRETIGQFIHRSVAVSRD